MFDDDDETTEEHERRIVRCRSCRAKIIWLKTWKGGLMPTDSDTVEPSDMIYNHEKHISHFATCPNAATHRKMK